METAEKDKLGGDEPQKKERNPYEEYLKRDKLDYKLPEHKPSNVLERIYYGVEKRKWLGNLLTIII